MTEYHLFLQKKKNNFTNCISNIDVGKLYVL